VIIETRHNSYERRDGCVVSWERGFGGEGHNVTMTDLEDNLTQFNWRAPNDPIAGDQITVIMPATGVSAKQNRPLMIMNQTTGEYFRQQNAPDPAGTRKIMSKLILWTLIALVISGAIIANTTGMTMLILQLAAAAIIVWRLAIATSDLRADERINQRKEDEEKTCMGVLAGEWQRSPQARKPRIDVSHLLPEVALLSEQDETKPA
jgi:hypothetical protein